jgi:hypothetical protein
MDHIFNLLLFITSSSGVDSKGVLDPIEHDRLCWSRLLQAAFFVD